MDINKFIQFAIERSMISNKYGIELFYTVFKEACGERFNKETNDGLIDNTMFYQCIIYLSEVFFAAEEEKLKAMFSRILIDKHITSDTRGKFLTGRCNVYIYS
jgi:hypothetical protein